MAIPSKNWAILGSAITGAGFVALLLSFASDRWLEAYNFEDTGFSNLGLWSICFRGKYFPPPRAAVSREYEGCWWALNKELDDLRSFLFPREQLNYLIPLITNYDHYIITVVFGNCSNIPILK